jgi:hypothetical protein
MLFWLDNVYIWTWPHFQALDYLFLYLMYPYFSFFPPFFPIYCTFCLVHPGNACYMNGETLLKRTCSESGHLRVSAKMLLVFTAWLLPFPLWLTGLATIQVNLHRTRRSHYSETKQLHDIHVQRERVNTHTHTHTHTHSIAGGVGGFSTR